MEPSESNIVARFQQLGRSDFWFADGNIVLVVGSSAFKVHRGQLERHSEVFNDLFSIPQPNEQTLFEGVPWVELHDEPAEVYHFLKALYDGLYFQQRHASHFPVVVAVLRLSTKYLVEHLRRHCLMCLEHDWPSTLVGWDRREKKAIDLTGRYSPRDVFPHPIHTIHLAQELNLTSVLACALYDLSRYGPSKVMMGTPRMAPLGLHPSDVSDDVLQAKPVEGGTDVYLSRDMLCRTFRGREYAQRYIAIFVERHLRNRPISATCMNRADDNGRYCRESFYFIMLNILRSVGGIASGRDGDPLHTLVQAVEMMNRTDFSDGQKQCGLRMCQSCKLDFAACVNTARTEVWGLVPGWFGISSRRESATPLCVK